MNYIWPFALLSTIAVSLISLVGVLFLFFRKESLQRIVFILVSFAVGALLGNTFFHLIPESFEAIPSREAIGILILTGVLTMLAMEKLLHWHHDHHVAQQEGPASAFGYLSLVADGLHNFTDGVLIAAGWLVSPEIGIATTLAVILHEIPQEISDYGILIHAGFSRKRALWLNFYSACSAIVGTLITLLLGSHMQEAITYILPFAAGSFIYLAGSDLIPELNKDRSRRNALLQILFILAGLTLMFLINGGHEHAGHAH